MGMTERSPRFIFAVVVKSMWEVARWSCFSEHGTLLGEPFLLNVGTELAEGKRFGETIGFLTGL